jgi:cellulose synthase/poly-beta-1,6-N-acetylglucosamine synthase-like glycosyltransferase
MPLTFALLSVLSMLAVVYPYLIYGKILRRWPSNPLYPVAGHKCSATLLFCAYNESSFLPEKLKNIAKLKLRHPNLEVLAFDDGSSDGSLQMMQAHASLLRVIAGAGRNGKAHGMKVMAAQAKGDILIFTDANVTLREDAIDALMAWYGDPQVGGVCGALTYLATDSSATASIGGRYWRLEETLKAQESRTGNVMGADGSIFSIRRSLYPEFPDTVLDDMTVSMHVVFAGKRLIKVEDVVAFEGAVAQRSEEIARKIRIAARAFHTHQFLRPQLARLSRLDKFKYISRKLIRWFGAGFLGLGALFFLLAMGFFNWGLPIILVLFFAVVGFTGLKAKHGLVAAVMEVVIALIATQIGVIRAIRGERFAVWNPAKSR